MMLSTMTLSFKTSFSQEVIVRFSEAVEVRWSPGASQPLSSTHAEVAAVLAENPPTHIRPMFARKTDLPPFLRNIQVWRYNLNSESQSAIDRLRGIGDVIYAEPNHAFKISQITNDVHYPQQWYLPQIHAPEAWELEKGSESLIVGVIDTGVDYLHEDLQGQLWINHPEDVNGNGMLDSADFNDIDDDGNGYIDDVVGWDFTDAPDFPDHGDYLEPDNDPMDEFMSGHGTPIAGIIAARQNNLIGISGIAPNVKVMLLRAGTASGFLEEDDVAEAIVYAVDNGCKIINMSFGDVAFSFLLRDAIQYGVNHGALFVAAAGNNGNAVLQYPAAYDGTISVGAATSSNSLASFSSYGNKLNLVAPGQNIFSLQIGNGYGANSGTSFAAPMVSAAAALIWSQYPNYSPEKVKGALYAACADLGYVGWDIYYGHGLLNLYRSLAVSNHGYAEIHSPAMNEGIAADQVAVIGTVFSPNIISYSLSFGMGENPSDWQMIDEAFGQQAFDDTLSLWDTSTLMDTVYTLELRLRQHLLPDVVNRTLVYLDHTPPLLNNLTAAEMLMGADNGVLIGLETDDPTMATLHYGPPASIHLTRTKTSQYFQNQHYLTLTQQEISGPVDYYIWLENASGLVTIDDNEGELYHLYISAQQPSENIFSVREQFPFSGYFLPKATDFNLDQNPEIVVSRRLDTVQYGPLQIWEAQNQQWTLRSETAFPAIPRDVADVDSDGRHEVLAGFGGATMILQAGQGSDFPSQTAMIDTANMWGSRLVNLNGDPMPELLAIQNEKWGIFDLAPSDFRPTLKQHLLNPTDGDNRYGIPWSLVEDFDQDGMLEIVIGDYDGDVLVFEDNGAGQYQPIWQQRLSGIDATHLLQAADVTGDGKKELITVTRHEPGHLTESTVIARYWNLNIWKSDTTNDFVLIWEKNFHGVNLQRGVSNGLAVLDINNDGIWEIYFSPFPRVYQIEYVNNDFEIGWYYEGVNGNTVLSLDFDQNGKPDILLNTDSGVRLFQYELNPNRPLPPAQVYGFPLDTNLVHLSWSTISTADYYKIYRKIEGEEFALLDSTQSNFYLDSIVRAHQNYAYAVTQVDLSFPQPESQFSAVVTVQPNAPPHLDTLDVIDSKQILLQFSEPMSLLSFNTNNFLARPQNRSPLSVMRGQNRRHVILSFKDDFSEGQNQLLAFDVTDAQGTPIRLDTLCYDFTYHSITKPFYLQKVAFVNKGRLRLVFSKAVDQESAARTENYILSPDGEIVSAAVEGDDPSIVNLNIGRDNRMGSLGVPYYIEARNIKDVSGNPLHSEHENKLMIISDVGDLSNVIVYPNPYRPNSENPLRFGNLPRDSEIFIFTSTGKFIRGLREDDMDGGLVWDLKTRDNHAVGSGVYFYVVRYQDQETKGKFIIVN